MQKRTKLGILSLAVLILFGLGIYLLLNPYLAQRVPAQPPALPDTTTPVMPTSRPRPKPGEIPTSTVAEVILNDQTKLRMLETKSATISERFLSGSNSDGFSGYEDVAGEFTSEGRTWLRSEQTRMQTAHPAKGKTYGVSARAVSSKLDQRAVWGDSTIRVTVQMILKEEAVGGTGAQSAKKVELVYVRQTDGTYLISSVTMSDIAL